MPRAPSRRSAQHGTSLNQSITSSQPQFIQGQVDWGWAVVVWTARSSLLTTSDTLGDRCEGRVGSRQVQGLTHLAGRGKR